MTKRVRFDVEAQEELEAAVAWSDAESRGTTLGSELLEETDRAIVLLADQAALFGFALGVSEQLGVRRCPLRRFPYALVFVEMPEEIRVLAFAHRRRRPGYWRGRLLPR